jgi:F0F1-type ATP synthase assembly protein I
MTSRKQKSQMMENLAHQAREAGEMADKLRRGQRRRRWAEAVSFGANFAAGFLIAWLVLGYLK